MTCKEEGRGSMAGGPHMPFPPAGGRPPLPRAHHRQEGTPCTTIGDISCGVVLNLTIASLRFTHNTCPSPMIKKQAIRALFAQHTQHMRSTWARPSGAGRVSERAAVRVTLQGYKQNTQHAAAGQGGCPQPAPTPGAGPRRPPAARSIRTGRTPRCRRRRRRTARRLPGRRAPQARVAPGMSSSAGTHWPPAPAPSADPPHSCEPPAGRPRGGAGQGRAGGSRGR